MSAPSRRSARSTVIDAIMVTVEVRILEISVGRGDVSVYAPPDPSNFGESVTVYLGARGESWMEAFYLLVCTPRWLAEQFDDPEATDFWQDDEFSDAPGPLNYYLPSPEPMTMFGTGLFLMRSWSADRLIRSIEAVCRRESSNEWGTIASRLTRLMPWESDYRWDAKLP